MEPFNNCINCSFICRWTSGSEQFPLKKCSLLVVLWEIGTEVAAQSGQLPSGTHIPRAPHAQTGKGINTGKSYWSLQNGEQNLPNIQSSQAIAPCFGGVFSMQSFGLTVTTK